MTTGLVGLALLAGAFALALRKTFFALRRAGIAALRQGGISAAALGATAATFQQRIVDRASTAFAESPETAAKREQLSGRLADNHATLVETVLLLGRLLVARIALAGDQIVDAAGRLTRSCIGAVKTLGVVLAAAVAVPARAVFSLVEVAIAAGQGAVDVAYVPRAPPSPGVSSAPPASPPPSPRPSPTKRVSPIRSRLENMIVAEEADGELPHRDGHLDTLLRFSSAWEKERASSYDYVSILTAFLYDPFPQPLKAAPPRVPGSGWRAATFSQRPRISLPGGRPRWKAEEWTIQRKSQELPSSPSPSPSLNLPPGPRSLKSSPPSTR